MKTINKGLIAALIIAIFITTTLQSCKKNQNLVNSINEQSTIKPAPKFWQIVAGAVVVIIYLSEGQATQTIITYPDGKVVKKTTCTGVGNCALNMVTNEPDNSGNPVSSDVVHGLNTDRTLVSTLKINKNGQLLLVANNQDNTIEQFNSFFFDDAINFGKGDFLIDNPYVLNKLGLEKELHIENKGEYQVFEKDNNTKYIILEQL